MVPLDPAETGLAVALGDDDGGGDAGVVTQRQVPPGHPEPARGGGDGAADLQRRASSVVADDLGIGPEQTAGRAERLREGLLGRKARRQRARPSCPKGRSS